MAVAGVVVSELAVSSADDGEADSIGVDNAVDGDRELLLRGDGDGLTVEDHVEVGHDAADALFFLGRDFSGRFFALLTGGALSFGYLGLLD